MLRYVLVMQRKQTISNTTCCNSSILIDEALGAKLLTSCHLIRRMFRGLAIVTHRAIDRLQIRQLLRADPTVSIVKLLYA